MCEKIFRISECAKFVVISTSDHKGGVKRGGQYHSADGALAEVDDSGTRMTSRASMENHFVGVEVDSAWRHSPEIFGDLLPRYEKMMQTDRAEDRINDSSELKLARVLYTLALNDKFRKDIIEKSLKDEATAIAMENLYNSDYE